MVKSKLTTIGHAPKPNGVTFDTKSHKLYVCTVGDKLDGSGILMEKDLLRSDTLFHPLQNSPVGFFDGIEQIDDSHLLISDWVGLKSTIGKFWIYDLISHTFKWMVWENSPADIFYDKSSGHVWIPQSLANRIVITTLSKIKKNKTN